MAIASQILRDLRAKLGEQADFLQHLPLDQVETCSSQEAGTLSFALFVGYIRCQYEGTKLSVLAHLFPATKPKASAQIQFLAYKGDKVHAKYDGDVISKPETVFSDAFKIPGKWTKTKLQAVAKYYFMEKLVQAGNEEDEEMMEFGMPISKTWVSDLTPACRAWQEGTKGRDQDRERASTEETVAQASAQPNSEEGSNVIQDNEGATIDLDVDPDSPLSDVVSDFLGETDEVIEGVREPLGAQVDQPQEEPQEEPPNERPVTPPHMNDDTSDTLFTLNDEEEDLSKEIEDVDAQIAALQEKLLEKEEKLKQIEDKKKRILSEFTSFEAVFKIGKEVGRKSGAKRIKLE